MAIKFFAIVLKVMYSANFCHQPPTPSPNNYYKPTLIQTYTKQSTSSATGTTQKLSPRAMNVLVTVKAFAA